VPVIEIERFALESVQQNHPLTVCSPGVAVQAFFRKNRGLPGAISSTGGWLSGLSPAMGKTGTIAGNYLRATLILLGFGIFSALVVLLMDALGGGDDPELAKLEMALPFLLPTLVLAWILREKPWSQEGGEVLYLSGRSVLLAILPCALALQVSASELETISRILFPWDDFYQELQRLLQPTGGWLDLLGAILTLAIIGPICEEILVRRFMMDRMLRAGPVSLAVIYQAFLFALLHLNPWQFFYALPIGILLGLCRIWSGGIYLPILLHVLNNGLAVIAMYVWPEMNLSLLPEPEHVPLHFLLPALLTLGVTIYVFQKYRIPARPAEPPQTVPTPT